MSSFVGVPHCQHGVSHRHFCYCYYRHSVSCEVSGFLSGHRRSSKKKRHVIDFENLPELPPGAFALAPHKDISLKSMPAVNTLLPPDHHYKAWASPLAWFCVS